MNHWRFPKHLLKPRFRNVLLATGNPGVQSQHLHLFCRCQNFLKYRFWNSDLPRRISGPKRASTPLSIFQTNLTFDKNTTENFKIMCFEDTSPRYWLWIHENSVQNTWFWSFQLCFCQKLHLFERCLVVWRPVSVRRCVLVGQSSKSDILKSFDTYKKGAGADFGHPDFLFTGEHFWNGVSISAWGNVNGSYKTPDKVGGALIFLMLGSRVRLRLTPHWLVQDNSERSWMLQWDSTWATTSVYSLPPLDRRFLADFGLSPPWPPPGFWVKINTG